MEYTLAYYANPTDRMLSVPIHVPDKDAAIRWAIDEVNRRDGLPELQLARHIWLMDKGHHTVAHWKRANGKWWRDQGNGGAAPVPSDVEIERDLAKRALRELLTMAGLIPATILFALNRNGELDSARYLKALQEADDVLNE